MRSLLAISSLCLAGSTALGSDANDLAPMGPEFVVTSHTAYDQHHAWIECDDHGNLVVAYSTGNVFARRLDGEGKPLGGDFPVNTSVLAGDQNECFVARDPISGDFVVCYSDWEGNDGERVGAYGRFFRADGTPYGGEQTLNQTTDESQFEPHAAFSPTGHVMTVWSDAGKDGSCGVFARLFDRTGAPLTEEFLVNEPDDTTQIDPTVACSRDGRFVIAFVDASGKNGQPRDVMARLFDAQGNALGPQFRVNEFADGMQRDPIVATAADGRFVVVWQDESGADGDGYGVFARRFDRDGNALGPQFALAQQALGNQRDPHVALDYVGNFVAVWESDLEGSWDVRLRAFDRNGAALSDELPAHVATAGDQTGARACVSQSGERVVVAWHDDRGDGDTLARWFRRRAVAPEETPPFASTIAFDVRLDGMAGATYLLLPSLGLAPAGNEIAVEGGRMLGLALDDMLLGVAAAPDPAVFAAFSGRLDANGEAHATFVVPNDPAWHGQPIHVAGITLESPLDANALANGTLDGVGFLSEVATAPVDGTARFHPGQRLAGEIASADDQDRGRFEALRGEKIRVRTTPVDLPIGPGMATRLRIDVEDLDGVVIASWSGHVLAGFKAPFVFRAPEHGAYFVRVRDDGGALGSYRIETTAKAKKGALPQTETVKVPKSGPAAASFLAYAGGTLDATVRPKKKSPAAAGLMLRTPSGATIDATPFVTADGDALVVAGLPLGETGKYRLLVSGPEKAVYAVDLAPVTPPVHDTPIILE